MAGAAFAADPPELIVEEVAYYPYPFVGYAELSFSGFAAAEDGTYDFGTETYEDSWAGLEFYGAGRIAAPITSSFSVQGDGWVYGWTGAGEWSDSEGFGGNYDFMGAELGAAVHLSWTPSERALIGVMGSLGANDYETAGTIAIEGSIGDEMWRAYGQIGLVTWLSDELADASAKRVYARGLVAYYFDPNMSLSGNLGVAKYNDDFDGGTETLSAVAGLRFDFKPDGLPFTGFVAYQGYWWDGGDDFGTWEGTEHTVAVGMRIPIGGDSDMTLREQDDVVGLYDLNPAYGAEFIR